jgi:hypothetical protein
MVNSKVPIKLRVEKEEDVKRKKDAPPERSVVVVKFGIAKLRDAERRERVGKEKAEKAESLYPLPLPLPPSPQ